MSAWKWKAEVYDPQDKHSLFPLTLSYPVICFARVDCLTHILSEFYQIVESNNLGQIGLREESV